MASASVLVLANLDGLLPELETIYKDIHSHPELSMQEERTAGVAANHLRGVGYEVTTGVGKTGVVGLLRNGELQHRHHLRRFAALAQASGVCLGGALCF